MKSIGKNQFLARVHTHVKDTKQVEEAILIIIQNRAVNMNQAITSIGEKAVRNEETIQMSPDINRGIIGVIPSTLIPMSKKIRKIAIGLITIGESIRKKTSMIGINENLPILVLTPKVAQGGRKDMTMKRSTK